MDLKTKWYDILLAGALFWLPQVYFLTILVPGFFSTFTQLGAFVTNKSEPLATLLSTAVLALATLFFLVTGNILDMLGAGLPFVEMGVFYQHLNINKGWARKALEKYAP